MSDLLIKASAYDATIRAIAVDSKNTLEKAIEVQGLNPLAATALGRGLTSVAMLSGLEKNENTRITFQIKGDGPMEGMVIVGDGNGTLKGYVNNNDYETYDGKKYIGDLFGKGMMHIIKDTGMSQPYIGQVELISGEVGDDLANYFTKSEQTPTLIALATKLNQDRTVKVSGGILIQSMPNADPYVVGDIQQKVAQLQSVSDFMIKNSTPKALLEALIDQEHLNILMERPVEYHCDCSREKFLRGVRSLGEKEIKQLIKEKQEIETQCSFCQSHYAFSPDELKSG